MDTSPAVPDRSQPITGRIVSGPPNENGLPVPAEDMAAHQFFNVLRHVVRFVPFINEDELHAALGVVDAFEKRTLSVPVEHVITNEDVAKREDVTQRRAPQVGTALAPVAGPPLDYNRLAAALLEAQRQQAQQNPPPYGGEGNPA
jgi:hypothetical protein